MKIARKNGKSLLTCLVLAFLALAIMSPPSLSLEVVASVITDESSYVLREMVEISGYVKYNGTQVKSGLIGIQVEDNRSTTILTRVIPTGTLNPRNWDVEIVAFYSCDSFGNPLDEFERGEKSHFRVVVKNNEPVAVQPLLTISVFDSAFIILGQSYASLPINAGTTAAFLAEIYIENWASPGNAPAFANVFTGWPKSGGKPYCPEEMINFSIIESPFEDPPSNPIPEEPIQNGTYLAYFRLSPEPLPGTYTVSVCAWYQGLISPVASTTFLVEDVASPPRASFIITPPMAGPNYTIIFDGTFSSAEGYNDTITNYTWDFGDQTSETGSTKWKVNHQYANVGNYTVTLNVTDTEGFWNATSKNMRIELIHNVALNSIEFMNETYVDWDAPIIIEVVNKGTFDETFNVTVYYNTSIADIKTVTLMPQERQDVNFQWDTTGLPMYVNYTISAQADILPSETDTTDNNITYGKTMTKAKGDLDGDKDVDIFDIVILVASYGSIVGEPNWNIQADLAEPYGQIDIFDVVIAGGVYGWEYP